MMNMVRCALLATVATMVSADIRAGSELGKRLLSKARRANDAQGNNNNYDGYVNYFENNGNGVYYGNNYYNGNNGNNGGNNGGNNYNGGNYNGGGDNQNQAAEWQWFSNYMMLGSSWLSQYSIKFQGCYDIFKWNQEAMDAEDVRLMTRQVVRFRLCPSDTCNANSANGCNGNHGDYIIDLNSYLEAYVEAKMAFQEWYDYAAADQNQANQDGYNAYDYNFDVQDYMECTATEIAIVEDEYANAYNNYNNGEGQNNNGDGNYYIGPYCANQGGAILMGMFKDDACSIPADETGGKRAYLEATNSYLPFSDRSMIEYDCFSCKQPEYYNDNGDNQNGNNNGQNNNGQNNYNGQNNNQYAQEEMNQIQEFCETAYLYSGKCEANLPSAYFNMYKQKNNVACNYMEGLKVSRDDGTIITTRRSAPGHLSNKAIGLVLVAFFGAACVGLSLYVCHLKTKFQRASIDLS